MKFSCPKCGHKTQIKDGDYPKRCKCGIVLRDNIGLFAGDECFNTAGSYLKPVIPQPPINRMGMDLASKNDITCSVTIDITNSGLSNLNHDHKWKPIKDSYDVECSICGIKAKRAVAYIVQD